MLTRLVVFSDDWGRHPSSCQHLVRRLLDRHPTLWLNTVGTRAPRLTREDLGKITVKLREFVSRRRRPGAERGDADHAGHAVRSSNLEVVSPVMWPGFRARWQKRVNRWSMARTAHRALGPRQPGERRVAITTLPITADLVGRLDVDAWIYYCVDDFSVWPGLDARVMLEMERDLVERVDHCLAVSQTLADRLAEMRLACGRASTEASAYVPLLTHGIDLAHWRAGDGQCLSSEPERSAQSAPDASTRWEDDPVRWLAGLPRPILLFWGLIDARLDRAWLEAMSRDPGLQRGAIVLIGPQQSPDPAIARLEAVHMPGPVTYDLLPRLARQADVLIMPYADQPVTRAMNPLKFKEYLACDRPVVARRLPATEAWGDAADLVESSSACVSVIHERLADGLPETQRSAREGRLPGESWDAKAECFRAVILKLAGRPDDADPGAAPGSDSPSEASSNLSGVAGDPPSDVFLTEAPSRG